MEGEYSICVSKLEKWPNKNQMQRLLERSGLKIYVGAYSIRINSCEHFVFQEYGFNNSTPSIDASAATVDKMIEDASLVSERLAESKIKHRFEIYNGQDELMRYLHFDWP